MMGSDLKKLKQWEDKIKLLEKQIKVSKQESAFEQDANLNRIQALRVQIKAFKDDIKHIIKEDQRTVKRIPQSAKTKSTSQSFQDTIGNIKDKNNILRKTRDLLMFELGQKKSLVERLNSEEKKLTKEASKIKLLNGKRLTNRQDVVILEEKLDKMKEKYTEIEYINKKYMAIRKALIEESTTYEQRLQEMEREMQEQQKDIEQLKQLNSDASRRCKLSKKLAKQEKSIATTRRRRYLMAKECKQNERMDFSSHIDQELPKLNVENEKYADDYGINYDGENVHQTSNFEETLKKLKEATGTCCIQELKNKFDEQEETKKNLVEMKEQVLRTRTEVSNQVQSLKSKIDELKTDSTVKKSVDENAIRELCDNLENTYGELAGMQNRLDDVTTHVEKLESNIRHIYGKLYQIYPKNDIPEIPSDLKDSIEEAMECLSLLFCSTMQVIDQKYTDKIRDLLIDDNNLQMARNDRDQHQEQYKLSSSPEISDNGMTNEDSDDKSDNEGESFNLERILLKKEAEKLMYEQLTREMLKKKSATVQF